MVSSYKAGAMTVSLLVVYRQQRNSKTYGYSEGICRVNLGAPSAYIWTQ